MGRGGGEGGEVVVGVWEMEQEYEVGTNKAGITFPHIP